MERSRDLLCTLFIHDTSADTISEEHVGILVAQRAQIITSLPTHTLHTHTRVHFMSFSIHFGFPTFFLNLPDGSYCAQIS